MPSAATQTSPTTITNAEHLVAARLRTIVERLRADELTLATAESLTGGLCSYLFVDTPDSGDVVVGGVVARTAELRRALLGVGDCTAVSAECALQMAVGAQRLLGSSCALAFTGVAGPGAQDGHPVGTVFVAASLEGTVQVERHDFDGTPDQVRLQSIANGVDQLASLLEARQRSMAARDLS